MEEEEEERGRDCQQAPLFLPLPLSSLWILEADDFFPSSSSASAHETRGSEKKKKLLRSTKKQIKINIDIFMHCILPEGEGEG